MYKREHDPMNEWSVSDLVAATNVIRGLAESCAVATMGKLTGVEVVAETDDEIRANFTADTSDDVAPKFAYAIETFVDVLRQRADEMEHFLQVTGLSSGMHMALPDPDTIVIPDYPPF